MKNTFIIWFLVLLLVLTGCSTQNKTKNDNEVIIEFLNQYYDQLTLSSDEWAEVWSELDETSQDDLESVELVHAFSEYLTESCLKRMVENRLIPDFNMEDVNIESFTIESLEISNKDENNYNVNYILKITELDGVNEYENKHEIRMNTVDDRRLIDSVFGDFVWKDWNN